jgi:hypothetical protein
LLWHKNDDDPRMHQKILNLYWRVQRGQPTLLNTKALRQKFLKEDKKKANTPHKKEMDKSEERAKYTVPTKN